MTKYTKFTGTILAATLAVTLLPAASVSAAQTEPVAVQKKSETDQLIVKVKAGKDINSIAAKHGAKLKKSLLKPEYKIVKVPSGKAEEFLAKFQNDGDVEFAELDEVVTASYTPNDPSYGSQYHIKRIQADLAWSVGCRGSSAVKIAVLDTGIDLQHPDLSSRIVPGYDFVNNDSNADDDQGHGTHVAGIIGASVNNSLNGAGIDWFARLIPVKVLSSTGSGYTSDIIDGVYFAADNGAKVINMSLGGGGYSSAFQSAINYAWNKGAVTVAAAGNNGNTAVQYPANYPNVLSVASTDSADLKSFFSTYGTWVDIAAPGSSIYSTRNGGGMTTMSGTSMAAPVVSGVAGLVWGRYGTGASPATIVNRITSTADKIAGTGSYWIHGRVNAYRACTQ